MNKHVQSEVHPIQKILLTYSNFSEEKRIAITLQLHYLILMFCRAILFFFFFGGGGGGGELFFWSGEF